jgi:ankyrin repeat protein
MAADFLDTCNGMSTLFKIEDNVFHDFIESDYRDRPPIFTWIEVNKIEMVRKTLDTDPLQANCTLPHGGWRPIHLAAWLGRVNIIFLLVQEYGVNPNSYTSSGKYYTPLHQAVGALSIDGINALLDSGANINAEAMSQTRPHTPLEYAILLDELAQEKRLEDVISLLLGRGANYLYSSVGEL